MLGLAQSIQIDQPVVHFTRALHHAVRVVHVVLLPVAQLAIRARLVQVRRLADDHLTHFVHEEGLAARQKAQNRGRLHALPIDELAQVELFIQHRACLVHHFSVVAPTEDLFVTNADSLDRLEFLEVDLDVIDQSILAIMFF